MFTKAEIEAGQLFLIDKPLTWTSFDVVNKMRYALRKAYGFRKLKVGHAGTLDPLATGLLLIAVGRKTKTINDLMGMDKTYTGEIFVGATRPSYDMETEVDHEFPTDHIDANLIEEVGQKFLGEIDQIPPIFSAIKKDGKKAYESAREGTDIKMEARKVRIQSLSLDSENFPVLTFEVSCSKGTYIRSLAHDIGQSLGSGAYLQSLRRTAIGDYSVTQAMQLDEFLASLPQKD